MGMFGSPRGWNFVTETNARESFHFHSAVHAGASPTFLEHIAHKETLRKAIADALDTM